MTADCHHADGAIVWNPFRMAVECQTCHEVFFRAVHEDGAYVLRRLGSLETDSEELTASLAAELFRAARNRPEETMNAVEQPIFLKMARSALRFLGDRARLAQEGR